ncbi:hypothetical protein RHSIM_Rhsim09G0090800 [Rhododendron simsii]|uniref:BED-type domain-containing protein n=1 Tax=Rhododendron simsii TaxID=118357 RepID=A0A834GGS2_RHOSS|nr:hypothetical protein RHSIM_Rhsim09G0090800 [Rhododendron simsii]
MRLKDSLGTWRTDQKEIAEVIKDHFQKLYMAPPNRDFGDLVSLIDPVISEDWNTKLTREVTKEEVQLVVFQMGALKAAGSDGFPGLFYQSYWDILGDDVFGAVSSFFQDGHLLKEMNQTNVTLIPKRPNLEDNGGRTSKPGEIRKSSIVQQYHKCCQQKQSENLGAMVAPAPHMENSWMCVDEVFLRSVLVKIGIGRSSSLFDPLWCDMSDREFHLTSPLQNSSTQISSFEDSSTSPIMANAGENADAIANANEADVGVGEEANYVVIEVIEEESNPFKRKERKKTSAVWNDFESVTFVDGSKKHQCKFCKDYFNIQASGSTTHLIRHLKTCVQRRLQLGLSEKRQKTSSFEAEGSESGNLTSFTYDHAKVREAASHMILYHDFCNVPPPHTGVIISDALYKCLVDWNIENKVATITVDNASYNDVALRNLKSTFQLLKKKLPLDGIVKGMWVFLMCLPMKSGKRVENVCQFLEIFNDVTNIISGCEYPTSNLFLTEVWRVKEILDKNSMSELEYLRSMALKMKGKFDKNWGECNLVMALGAALDPRYKLVLIGFCFPEIYGDKADQNIAIVHKSLYDLYDECVVMHFQAYNEQNLQQNNTEVCTLSSVSKGKKVATGKSKYESFVRKADTIQPVKSDLDIYLKEGVYICASQAQGVEVSDPHFDALEWWKANTLKYCILSKMACDILSIPITSVASESTFSAGGRVIDPYCASLAIETVEMLLCGADYVRAYHGLKKGSDTKEPSYKEFILP